MRPCSTPSLRSVGRNIRPGWSSICHLASCFVHSDGGGAGRDANDDKRIELNEWMKGYKTVQDHGLVGLAKVATKKQAEKVFNTIDDNGVSPDPQDVTNVPE